MTQSSNNLWTKKSQAYFTLKYPKYLFNSSFWNREHSNFWFCTCSGWRDLWVRSVTSALSAPLTPATRKSPHITSSFVSGIDSGRMRSWWRRANTILNDNYRVVHSWLLSPSETAEERMLEVLESVTTPNKSVANDVYLRQLPRSHAPLKCYRKLKRLQPWTVWRSSLRSRPQYESG